MTVELKRPHSRHLKLITRMTQLARMLSNDKIKKRPVSASPSQANTDFIRPLFPGVSQSERELVEGVILEGKSQQEVAQALNIPLSVVRSKTRSAMQVHAQVSYTLEV
jgi:DNA-directed RNA polymerase specialized sigma24 family protein